MKPVKQMDRRQARAAARGKDKEDER